jgi:hypothetical protein
MKRIRSTRREKVHKRLSSLPKAEVQAWGTTCLTGVWRAYEDYEKYGQKDSLAEIREGLETLHGVIDVLYER